MNCPYTYKTPNSYQVYSQISLHCSFQAGVADKIVHESIISAFGSDLPTDFQKLPRMDADGARLKSSEKNWHMSLYAPNPLVGLRLRMPYEHLPKVEAMLENWALDGILVNGQLSDVAYSCIQVSNAYNQWEWAGIINAKHLVFIRDIYSIDELHNPGRTEYHPPIEYEVAHKMWLGAGVLGDHGGGPGGGAVGGLAHCA